MKDGGELMADETKELGQVPRLRDEGDDTSAPRTATTATPSEWRKGLFPASESGRPHAESYKHQAAAALHGWDLHRYHTGEEMQLSRADYEAAIRAANELKDGGYAPHEAALSEHLKQRADEVLP